MSVKVCGLATSVATCLCRHSCWYGVQHSRDVLELFQRSIVTRYIFFSKH